MTRAELPERIETERLVLRVYLDWVLLVPDYQHLLVNVANANR